VKTKVVRCEINDHIAPVTMDSPSVNAQDQRNREEMMPVFDTISGMDNARITAPTGAGRVYSARANAAKSPVTSRIGKPVIAALNGPALGAGLAVAASCDILVASETASLGLPEIDVGLMGGGRYAQRLFPHSLLRRVMLTGYRVPGPELYRSGIVEACVPPDQLMDWAMELARTIAAKSPVASRIAKRALNTIEEMSLRDGYRFEQNMTYDLSGYEDSKEAMLAFAEKRPPVFKGS